MSIQTDETERGFALRIAANIDTATPEEIDRAWAILDECGHYSEALLKAMHVVYHHLHPDTPGERRIGVFGSRFDIRRGQQQVYTDGSPVREGDLITHTQSSGLLPSVTTVGVAAFCPWGEPGELYVEFAENRYANMYGSVTRR